jgi:hypothetical protein
VIRRNIFRHLTEEEKESGDMIDAKRRFTEAITAKLGPEATGEDLVNISANTPKYELYTEEDELPIDDEPDYELDTLDAYIASQVLLPKGDKFKLGTVKKRLMDINGYSIGCSNDNPILDSRVYAVEFPDGEVLEYTANTIAKNLYS